MTQWSGQATPEATLAWCATHLPEGARGRAGDLAVSRLGWGTLPGELKNIVDSKIESALVRVLEGGLNVIDSSPAYRHRRSQAALGHALDRQLARGWLRRQELLVTTHAGWLAFDRQEEAPELLLEREVLPATGLTREDFVGGVWSLRPAWLRHQLELSRGLCRLQTLDLLLLDAPETGLKVWTRERWRGELREAFHCCEQLAAEGLIGGYGVASLEGFRADAQGRSPLDLDELLALARQAAGARDDGGTRFRALQLPCSLAALDLLNLRTGSGAEFRARAAEAGLWVAGLLSLGQGQLTSALPGYFREIMPTLRPAQQALHVLLSMPGLDTALVGMKTREHIEENLALLRAPRLSGTDWRRVFSDEA